MEVETRYPLYKVYTPSGVGAVVEEISNSGQIAGGVNLIRFESLLAKYLETTYITTTSDASSSLVMSLYMAGVRPGDEVICSPMACLATNQPVLNLFAQVKWCDVDPRTGNMDPDDLAARITGKTRAILACHWAGFPAELDRIYQVAREHGVAVVEDASEALGAEYLGRMIGNTGSNYTVFSFYPNKLLHTFEGGAVTFAREEDFARGRYLKRYGIHQPSFRRKDGEINPDSDIPEAGYNIAMNNISAGVGVLQMLHMAERVARHRENGEFYDAIFRGAPGAETLEHAAGGRPVYWVYPLLVDDPESFITAMRKRGIQSSRVHLRNDLYSCFGERADLPGVERFSSRCVSIPCGWWISPNDREVIAEGVLDALK